MSSTQTILAISSSLLVVTFMAGCMHIHPFGPSETDVGSPDASPDGGGIVPTMTMGRPLTADAGARDTGSDTPAPDTGACGVLPSCDDHIPCTLDVCAEGICLHAVPDRDGDGYELAGCLGGDDCDDGDPSIHPGAEEICDGRDNDCNDRIDDSPAIACPSDARHYPCTTSCGTPGLVDCDATCHFATQCLALSETCGNMCDDDGNGAVDDGCGAGAVPNDTCLTGIDITGGGTFTGTTCGADDTLLFGSADLSCGSPITPGTPDVFYVIHPNPTGSDYTLSITDGFAIQYVPTACSGNGGCGPSPTAAGKTFRILGSAGPSWYIGIERSDGTCGTFTLTVRGS